MQLGAYKNDTQLGSYTKGREFSLCSHILNERMVLSFTDSATTNVQCVFGAKK